MRVEDGVSTGDGTGSKLGMLLKYIQLREEAVSIMKVFISNHTHYIYHCHTVFIK